MNGKLLENITYQLDGIHRNTPTLEKIIRTQGISLPITLLMRQALDVPLLSIKAQTLWAGNLLKK